MTTLTEALLQEMARCRGALLAYRKRAAMKDPYGTKEHAAAHRATLDLSRLLVTWRQKPVQFEGEK